MTDLKMTLIHGMKVWNSKMEKAKKGFLHDVQNKICFAEIFIAEIVRAALSNF